MKVSVQGTFSRSPVVFLTPFFWTLFRSFPKLLFKTDSSQLAALLISASLVSLIEAENVSPFLISTPFSFSPGSLLMSLLQPHGGISGALLAYQDPLTLFPSTVCIPEISTGNFEIVCLKSFLSLSWPAICLLGVKAHVKPCRVFLRSCADFPSANILSALK